MRPVLDEDRIRGLVEGLVQEVPVVARLPGRCRGRQQAPDLVDVQPGQAGGALALMDTRQHTMHQRFHRDETGRMRMFQQPHAEREAAAASERARDSSRPTRDRSSCPACCRPSSSATKR